MRKTTLTHSGLALFIVGVFITPSLRAVAQERVYSDDRSYSFVFPEGWYSATPSDQSSLRGEVVRRFGVQLYDLRQRGMDLYALNFGISPEYQTNFTVVINTEAARINEGELRVMVSVVGAALKKLDPSFVVQESRIDSFGQNSCLTVGGRVSSPRGMLYQWTHIFTDGRRSFPL